MMKGEINMKELKSETILVDRDAYFYLRNIMREQRGCVKLTTEQDDRIWAKAVARGKAGKAMLDDLSMGGGDGTYNGKWWSWSVETMKNMLDAAGYHYEESEPFYYINA